VIHVLVLPVSSFQLEVVSCKEALWIQSSISNALVRRLPFLLLRIRVLGSWGLGFLGLVIRRFGLLDIDGK
jgi:hypothetical protein